MISQKLPGNFLSLLYQFYYYLLKEKNMSGKRVLSIWICSGKKLIIFINTFKSNLPKQKSKTANYNHTVLLLLLYLYIYQAAIPPSARDSDPPTRTPVSGSRQIICPRPKEFGSSSILIS